MRTDVETAAARLQYLSNAQHTMQQDIALTKRATEKTTVDVSKAQESKLEQVRIAFIQCHSKFVYKA